MSTKQKILDFIKKSEGGATYSDMHSLGFCRATLRRWVIELENEGAVKREREHPRARAVFSVIEQDCDMTFVT
jgi:hypothetical protein